jgi:hypothetical protein
VPVNPDGSISYPWALIRFASVSNDAQKALGLKAGAHAYTFRCIANDEQVGEAVTVPVDITEDQQFVDLTFDPSTNTVAMAAKNCPTGAWNYGWAVIQFADRVGSNVAGGVVKAGPLNAGRTLGPLSAVAPSAATQVFGKMVCFVDQVDSTDRLSFGEEDIFDLARTPPANQRFVVLGDSIAYGHGLADPKLNEPPSVDAYPEVVRRGLQGLRPLAYRATGCDLGGPGTAHTYDQLAISGAPSIANQWTGRNNNCGQRVHAAVMPEEIVAANLRSDPPALVTIQAGADDINFAGCLEALVGAPALLLGAHTCVRDNRNGYYLTAEAIQELASLQAGLARTIETIHGAAPHARIVVLNYYQLIPPAGVAIEGTTALCRAIRLHGVSSAWRQTVRGKAEFVQQNLNGNIAAVVSRFPDVKLADVSNTFSGHEFCTHDTWLFSGAHDAGHPTRPGHVAIGGVILARCAGLPANCVGRE